MNVKEVATAVRAALNRVNLFNAKVDITTEIESASYKIRVTEIRNKVRAGVSVLVRSEFVRFATPEVWEATSNQIAQAMLNYWARKETEKLQEEREDHNG